MEVRSLREHGWRQRRKYDDLSFSEAKRLKDLERETTQSRKLFQLSLDGGRGEGYAAAGREDHSLNAKLFSLNNKRQALTTAGS